MKLAARWNQTLGARGALVAWGVSAIVAALFMVVERGSPVPLVWIGACIVLPLLWSSKGKALRAVALAAMIGFGVFSLSVMVAIASGGRWDLRETIVFALTATTTVAVVLTLVVAWRHRGIESSATATSQPSAAAGSEEPRQAAPSAE